MKTTQFYKLVETKTKDVIFADILDEATQDNLVEYFYYRFCCDNDEKFIRYFKRNMNQYKRQYEQALRIETTDFDPMVSRYLERKYVDEYTRTDNETETNTDSKSTTGTDKTAYLNGGTVTINAENTVTGNYENDGTTNDNTTKTNTQEVTDTTVINTVDTSRTIGSLFPQTSLEIGTSEIGDLTYASNMADVKTTHDEDTTDTTSGTSTDNITGIVKTSNTGTDSTETTGETTETRNLNGSQNKTLDITEALSGNKTTEANSNYNLTHKEIFTGRESAPHDMLDRAREYIYNTNAFMWLVKQLDKCFMANLLIEEDD